MTSGFGFRCNTYDRHLSMTSFFVTKQLTLNRYKPIQGSSELDTISQLTPSNKPLHFRISHYRPNLVRGPDSLRTLSCCHVFLSKSGWQLAQKFHPFLAMLGSRTPPATIDGNIVISATLVYDNVYDSMLLSTFLEYNPYLPFRGTASSEKLLFLF